MSNYYRALISVPISANTDDEALDIAFEYAVTLLHPNSGVVAGHVELLSEVNKASETGLDVQRTVYADNGLFDQLPVEITRGKAQQWHQLQLNVFQREEKDQQRKMRSKLAIVQDEDGK